METLKPCPCCTVSSLVQHTYPDRKVIVCTACGASAGLDVWNRRPIEDALRAEISTLEDWGSKLVWNLTDGRMSKLYDIPVITSEVEAIYAEYYEDKTAALKAKVQRLEAVRKDLQKARCILRSMWWTLDSDGQSHGRSFLCHRLELATALMDHALPQDDEYRGWFDSNFSEAIKEVENDLQERRLAEVTALQAAGDGEA